MHVNTMMDLQEIQEIALRIIKLFSSHWQFKDHSSRFMASIFKNIFHIIKNWLHSFVKFDAKLIYKNKIRCDYKKEVNNYVIKDSFIKVMMDCITFFY